MLCSAVGCLGFSPCASESAGSECGRVPFSCPPPPNLARSTGRLYARLVCCHRAVFQSRSPGRVSWPTAERRRLMGGEKGSSPSARDHQTLKRARTLQIRDWPPYESQVCNAAQSPTPDNSLTFPTLDRQTVLTSHPSDSRGQSSGPLTARTLYAPGTCSRQPPRWPRGIGGAPTTAGSRRDRAALTTPVAQACGRRLAALVSTRWLVGIIGERQRSHECVPVGHSVSHRLRDEQRL